jgi:hypothetical protein
MSRLTPSRHRTQRSDACDFLLHLMAPTLSYTPLAFPPDLSVSGGSLRPPDLSVSVFSFAFKNTAQDAALAENKPRQRNARIYGTLPHHVVTLMSSRNCQRPRLFSRLFPSMSWPALPIGERGNSRRREGSDRRRQTSVK